MTLEPSRCSSQWVIGMIKKRHASPFPFLFRFQETFLKPISSLWLWFNLRLSWHCSTFLSFSFKGSFKLIEFPLLLLNKYCLLWIAKYFHIVSWKIWCENLQGYNCYKFCWIFLLNICTVIFRKYLLNSWGEWERER